ncbi:MAG: AraC family transcriptional regulator, partial [Clostridia bacterium]|nr:AraC family transcriptional regulator [Clostridia bacterium]
NVHGARGFMLNGEFYKCNERDLVIIPKFYTHKAIVNKGSAYERYLINVDESVVNMILSVTGVADNLDWLIEDNSKVPKKVNLSPEQSDVFVKLIDDYIRIKADENHLEAFSVFMNILIYLSNVFKHYEKIEQLDESCVTYEDKVLKYIENNFKTVTVSDIAKNNNIDRDYLNRVFKQETDISIKSYIILRKITEAKKYLYMGKTVREACAMAGFKDYANFARVFKKYEGYPPSKIEEYDKF